MGGWHQHPQRPHNQNPPAPSIRPKAPGTSQHTCYPINLKPGGSAMPLGLHLNHPPNTKSDPSKLTHIHTIPDLQSPGPCRRVFRSNSSPGDRPLNLPNTQQLPPEATPSQEINALSPVCGVSSAPPNPEELGTEH